MRRVPAAPDVTDLVGWHWIPVWDVPEGEVHRQQVLQYPTCQLVVTAEYARLYGVVRDLSTVELVGTGWAMGTALRPGAGRLLHRRPISELTDTHVDLDQVAAVDHGLVADVRAQMAPDPSDRDAHAAACATVTAALRPLLPLDDDGHRVNRLVELVEEDSSLTRVSDLAAALGWSERTLQRLCRDRLGLTPKWLLQRRRLHEASLALQTGEVDLAALAADLGYADQAHFTNDWTRVVGSAPGAYAADQ